MPGLAGPEVATGGLGDRGPGARGSGGRGPGGQGARGPGGLLEEPGPGPAGPAGPAGRGMTLPGPISPPLSSGARRPSHGRAEACCSAANPAPVLLPGPRQGAAPGGRATAAPGGRGVPGANMRWPLECTGAGRGAAEFLSRARCNLTFSSLEACNSWINCNLDLADWEGSSSDCNLCGAVI